jgi:hypothetical protein
MTPALGVATGFGVTSDYVLNKKVIQPTWPVHEDEKGQPIINNEQDAENFAINSALRGLGGMATGVIMSGAAGGVKWLMNRDSLANKINRVNLAEGDPLGKMVDFAKNSQTLAKDHGSIHANSTTNPENMTHTDIMRLNRDTAKNVDNFMGELSTQTTPVTTEQVAK